MEEQLINETVTRYYTGLVKTIERTYEQGNQMRQVKQKYVLGIKVFERSSLWQKTAADVVRRALFGT